MIGERLYECSTCGHQWNPGEVFDDGGSVECEVCGEADVFVREVQKGYQRGVRQAAEREQESWSAFVDAHDKAGKQAKEGRRGGLIGRVRARLNRRGGVGDTGREQDAD